MAYTLIPGFRQDEKGRNYQLAQYPNGKLIQVPVAQPALKSDAMMEKIMVESKSTLRRDLPDLGIDRPDPVRLPIIKARLARGDLYASGDVYETLACFKEKSV